MNKHRRTIYAWRNGITKFRDPHTVEWSRKLTTKEREAFVGDPLVIFTPRDCRIVFRKEPNLPYNSTLS